MHSPRRVLVTGAACALSVLCLAGSLEAHNWGCWRQPNRTVYTYNTAALSSQASAALSDWDNKTILSIPRVSYHTEVSVFDGYYGNTGWAGLASIESYSGCNILHGHARVNRSYSYTSNGYRGIFCQEVGHLFGLDHSNDGGCMGGGYYYSINTYYTVVQHNINDIYNKYSGTPLASPSPDAIAAEGSSGGAVPAAFGGEVPEEGQARAVAFWHDRPKTLEEAYARAEAVVAARVIEVRSGPDLVVPVPGLEKGVDRIPTQRILLSVDKVLAGTMKGRVFEVFRTGDEEFTVAEDPSYAAGERYVLFLTTKERGTYRVIAPEGRLKIEQTGLAPSSKREFLSELSGRTVESLVGDLAKMTRSEAASEVAGIELRRNAPVGSRSSLSYALPRASAVTLRIFDAQGRLVRTLVDAHQDGPQWYTVEWDGANESGRPTASGTYFARLETSMGVKSISIVRVR